MEQFYNFAIAPLNDILWSYILVFLLIILGVYFTVKSRFVQFRLFPHMFKLLTESTGHRKDKSISSFQAFCIGTASRVGTGNLTGIALAIVAGGPGAIFWMWCLALLGSASAFVESTLAQIYKVKDGKRYRGGPAYYIEQGLKQKWMAWLFCVLIIVTFGFVFNAVQANTIAVSFEKAFNIPTWLIGSIITIATGLIIFGGVRRIAVATEIIVPIMAVAYLFVVFYIMILHYQMIPELFSIIVSSAFGIKPVVGGVLGVTVKKALENGIRRGLFSNEAGMGSAPNAAATAEVSHPVKQGLIQALGVFSDTLVICSATAFVVILAGKYNIGNYTGIQLTQESFSSLVGPWGDTFIAVCILMFAFSSIIGNYYYGETNVEFIGNNKHALLMYRLVVLYMVMFGSLQKVAVVWNTADFSMGLMALVNLIALIFLGKIAIAALKDYTKQLKQGKNPVFFQDDIEGVNISVECWPKRKNNEE
jgi:alanine or glycine:cation symporter, AGCS family